MSWETNLKQRIKEVMGAEGTVHASGASYI